jgi:hypothetical protein
MFTREALEAAHAWCSGHLIPWAMQRRGSMICPSISSERGRSDERSRRELDPVDDGVVRAAVSRAGG